MFVFPEIIEILEKMKVDEKDLEDDSIKDLKSLDKETPDPSAPLS